MLTGAPVIRYGIVNETTGELEQFTVQVQYVLGRLKRNLKC